MSQEKSKKFLTKLGEEDKHLYKIIGTDRKAAEKAWWIIRVDPDKLAIFGSIIDKGNLTLSNYGEVLDSGFGEEIPEDILKKYGIPST